LGAPEFFNKLSLTGNNSLEAVQRWRAYTGRRFAAVRGSNIHFKVLFFFIFDQVLLLIAEYFNWQDI